jgi:hypothetical protein
MVVICHIALFVGNIRLGAVAGATGSHSEPYKISIDSDSQKNLWTPYSESMLHR